MTTEKPCSDHPDAPHGFVRNSSHSVGHYVCECSGWTPPDPKSLQERLRDGADICYARNIQLDYARVVTEAADRIDALEAENKNLQTVMMAAAVEIAEHWDDHCDAEGYGPINLLRRLEAGYPAQYGYDAQTVVRMESRIDALEAEAVALTKDAERLDHIQVTGSTVELVNFGQKPVQHSFRVGGLYKAINFDLRLAIDAAMKESK